MSMPLPSAADILIISFMKPSFSRRSLAVSILSSVAASALFMAAITGALAVRSFSIMASSFSRMPFTASTMKSMASTSLSESYATFTIYSPSLFLGSVTPGVSRNTI